MAQFVSDRPLGRGSDAADRRAFKPGERLVLHQGIGAEIGDGLAGVRLGVRQPGGIQARQHVAADHGHARIAARSRSLPQGRAADDRAVRCWRWASGTRARPGPDDQSESPALLAAVPVCPQISVRIVASVMLVLTVWTAGVTPSAERFVIERLVTEPITLHLVAVPILHGRDVALQICHAVALRGAVRGNHVPDVYLIIQRRRRLRENNRNNTEGERQTVPLATHRCLPSHQACISHLDAARICSERQFPHFSKTLCEIPVGMGYQDFWRDNQTLPDAPPQSWFGHRLPPEGHAFSVAPTKDRFVVCPMKRYTSGTVNGRHFGHHSPWQYALSRRSWLFLHPVAGADSIFAGRSHPKLPRFVCEL